MSLTCLAEFTQPPEYVAWEKTQTILDAAETQLGSPQTSMPNDSNGGDTHLSSSLTTAVPESSARPTTADAAASTGDSSESTATTSSQGPSQAQQSSGDGEGNSDDDSDGDENQAILAAGLSGWSALLTGVAVVAGMLAW